TFLFQTPSASELYTLSLHDALPIWDLSREAASTLKGASAALAKMERVLDGLDGTDGLFASVQRTSDSLNDAAGPRLEANLNETRSEERRVGKEGKLRWSADAGNESK